MPDPDLPALRLPSPERRETVVQTLSSHFAAGRIELEDLERRLEVAMRAQTLQELDAALDGLASVSAPAVPDERPVVAQDGASRRTVAVMSGVKKKGRWFLAPIHRVVSFWGAAVLDLREAQFTAEVTELRVRALMGGVEVILPPDLPVRVESFALMGGVVDRSTLSDAPRVIIRAFAVMGGIEVRVRERKALPSASPEGLGQPPRRKRVRGN